MENREKYIDKLSAKLKEWDADIQQLEEKMERAKTKVRADYQEELDELRARKDEAREKLREIQEASGDAWEELKVGMEKSWDILSDAFKNAFEKFK
ncbi:coiled coil domain-containing protein [Gaoshiqia sediminis]|uniref:Coiled coil domain-containing protein n=1 Tax=Gaoshiqia sediminis TaxID=2986998 RepID=A0AA41Y416_9BACT|nr:coiled coil domain-containing protein [Gaoshiqia sediminis]MCW0481106.1 coiled coil domain-containing protein [Gaoshiqia sediminis]